MTTVSFGQQKDSLETEEIICFVSEPQPSYPGGFVEMNKFIVKNLRYPIEPKVTKGKVFVGFVVNENGSLSDIEIVKGLGDEFDKSALEVFKKMPNWIPAKKENKPIRTKMIMPITFDK
jgi:protein TonB